MVVVAQGGGYRVNERELVNASAETLRAAIVKVAGADRDRPVTVRADGRATHQSVVTAMDVLGAAGVPRAQHRDGRCTGIVRWSAPPAVAPAAAAPSGAPFPASR